MAAVELTQELSDLLGWRVDETLLWNCATIDDVISIIDIESAAAEHEPAARSPSAGGLRQGVELADALERGGDGPKRDR